MKTKFNEVNESGRSMVEMLGVLAVMGVLSVGGGAMYTSAMNKHRANEILNEASKRAVAISAQILSGRNYENVSLSEFTNNDLGYAKFKTSISEATNIRQFNVLLESAPDSKICSELKSTVGKSSVIRQISDNCTAFTFNADLGTNDQLDVGSCENGNIFLSYNSDPCTITINEDKACEQHADCGRYLGCCINGKCSAGHSWDNNPVCQDNPEKCVKNSDCPSGYFCSIGTSDDRTPQYGSCVEISSLRAQWVPNSDVSIGKIHYKAKTFLIPPVAGVGLYWWGTQNWCKAQGMRMATLSDLQLAHTSPLSHTDGVPLTDEEINLLGSAINCCVWTSEGSVYGKNFGTYKYNVALHPLCVRD